MENNRNFGFSFHDEGEINNMITTAIQSTRMTYAEKLEAIEKLIVPFLENLAQSPEKTIIKWPNRKEVVEEHLNKFLEILRAEV